MLVCVSVCVRLVMTAALNTLHGGVVNTHSLWSDTLALKEMYAGLIITTNHSNSSARAFGRMNHWDGNDGKRPRNEDELTDNAGRGN